MGVLLLGMAVLKMLQIVFTVSTFIVYTDRPYNECLVTRDSGVVVVAGSFYRHNIHCLHRKAVYCYLVLEV